MSRPFAAFLFAWAGAALFAASLVYFLFSYSVTFGETDAIGPLWPNAAVNLVLFGLFALHHSVFARTPVRSWLARTVSPQVERALYVWVASLMLIVVCALWRPLPGVAWDVGPAGTAILWCSGWLGGIWLTLRSVAIIDVWELAGVRQVSTLKRRSPAPGPAPADAQRPADEGGYRDTRPQEFRVEGPYAWVRHPIYLGWFLIVFSVTPMTMTRLMFAVVSSAYVLLAIPLEERTLRRTSGGAYERYMRQVRWRVFPGVY